MGEQLAEGQQQTDEQLASASCSQTEEIEPENEVVALEVIEGREVVAELGAGEEETKEQLVEGQQQTED